MLPSSTERCWPLRLAALALMLAGGGQALAGESLKLAAEGEVEELVVVAARTGSRIKRQAVSPTPLAEYGAEDLRDQSAKDIRDLVGTLPISNGAENNSDNLTQNYTVGTANINLRGLGVSSTLVLLNGRRQVTSAVQTDEGASFVDLAALLPVLAVERMEVLKDGASAIYGSDAVAGVVNFITRQGYEGAEIQVEYRTRTNNGSQDDLNIDGVLGGQLGADASFLLAASYLDRNSLTLGEVDWLRPSTSGFGNPGSFNVPSLGRTVADPGCEANGGLLQELSTGSTVCRFDFGPQINAVPVENRLQTYARGDWSATGAIALWAELGYARNDISRETSPSFPVLSTPVVPAHNPGNIFGEDVLFQGRPYGNGQPPEINYYKHDTVRLALGVQGELASGLSWDLSYVRAANDVLLNPRDVIADNFQAALAGFGGQGCNAGAGAPPRPGEGDCLYFNPFSSVFSARPGDSTYNDPRVRDFIIGDYIGNVESEMQELEINLTGAFGSLPGGPMGFALGAQYRDESLAAVYDSITQQDGFAFLIGNANFSGSTDVYAAYGEVLLPVSSWLEATGALRFEDYGGGVGSTLDPKLSLFISPSSQISLRASIGTSFRAPSTFQTRGVSTNFVNIRDFDGSQTFAGRRTVGDPNLQPETSTAFNIGGSWQPWGDVEFDLDYWNYAFRDVLRKQNSQSIVNANPFDPRIQRTSAGTISIVHVAFINADAIDVSGIDFLARGSFETPLGLLSPFIEGTRMLSYKVSDQGRSVNGLGRLNRANVGAPNQKLKVNLGAGLERGLFSLNLLVRHVGRYKDDGGTGIGAFTTLDFNLGFDLSGLFRRGPATSIRLGVSNLTDEDPPFVNVAGSYDPRSADPRGRRAFIRLESTFGG